MKSYTLLKHGILLIALSLFFFSCDSTSSNEDSGQPPHIPDLEAIQPDISYFTDNNPMKQTAYDHFYEGKTYAGAFANMTSLGQYTSMWLLLTQMEGQRSDGRWVWDFTVPTDEGTSSMLLSARESGNEFVWDMTISISSADVNISNFKMFEGRTSQDGSRGSWTFYNMDYAQGGQPLLVSTWEQKSETDITIETKIYHDNGTEEGRFTYTQNGPGFSMVGSPSDSSSESITIAWNTDTMLGYIEQGGVRKCWDSNFQDTACS